ncbi:hypothetical protein HK096_009143, partial [Nowakowskiella sp. JEL0078]
MSDWIKIATDIELNYQLFDAFIILHGTDTMAYTASALSFMLEGLGKSVIITGSQVPLAEVRNDAVDNLLGALTIAGHFLIPEVGLFFGTKLYRGNRSSKIDAVDLNAFDSPNLRPLISVGVNIDVNWSDILKPSSIPFRAHKHMCPNVSTLRFFPGITISTIRAILNPRIESQDDQISQEYEKDSKQGVILETYGAGNLPSSRLDVLSELKKASDRGVVIVNITQCKKGRVLDLYEAGKVLEGVGVVGGGDMTSECALTKLSYLLSLPNITPSLTRDLIKRNLRGEITIPNLRHQFTGASSSPTSHGTIVELVAGALGILNLRSSTSIKSRTDLPTDNIQDTSKVVIESQTLHTPVTATAISRMEGELQANILEKVMGPLLLCYACGVGDLEGVKYLIGNPDDTNTFEMSGMGHGNIVNHEGSDGRTPLHIASSQSHLTTPSIVQYLLNNGASLHVRDSFGKTPLYYSVITKNAVVVDLLRGAGAHFGVEEQKEV